MRAWRTLKAGGIHPRRPALHRAAERHHRRGGGVIVNLALFFGLKVIGACALVGLGYTWVGM